MSSTPENIARNLARIQERIAQAAARAHRTPQTIRLIPVTKTVGISEMRILYDLGIREFAENRVEIARGKIAAFENDSLQWHMIGNIQRRKTRDIAALFDNVDAIDRIEAAEALQNRCVELNRRLNILLEVNVSGETAKHGFAPDHLQQALNSIRPLDRLQIQGLLTMAPFEADPEFIRSVFRRLYELAQLHQLPEVSMGMSGDFEIAIEEGATQIRIGSALFE